MIGKIISKAAENNTETLLKNKGDEDGISSKALFTSLLDALQGQGQIPEGTKEVKEGGAEENLNLSPKEMETLGLSGEGGDFEKILTNSDLKNEDVAELRQLLRKLKQKGDEPLLQGEEVSGPDAKGQNGDLTSRITEPGKDVGEDLPTMSKEDSLKQQIAEAASEVTAVEESQKGATTLQEGGEGTGKTSKMSDELSAVKDMKNNLSEREIGEEGKVNNSRAGELLTEKGQKESGETSVSTQSSQKIIQAENPVLENPIKQEKDDSNLASGNKSGDKDGQVLDRFEKPTPGKGDQGDKRTRTIHKEAQLIPDGKEKRVSEDPVTSNRASFTGIDNKDGSTVLGQNRTSTLDGLSVRESVGATSEKGLEMRKVQIDKNRKKEEETRGSFSGRGAVTGDNVRIPLGAAISSETGSQASTPFVSGGSLNGNSESMDFILDEQELMWKEYAEESAHGKEEKDSNAQPAMKLGQIPVTNTSLRKNMLPQIAQGVLKAASEAKETPEKWQKHNFTLDDGKNIQISVRESKGVLQVKMGSLNLDLSKLLQQNLQQIRDHLKQEAGLEIDLQFENQGQEETSHFSEGSSSPNKGGSNLGRNVNDRILSEDTGDMKFKAVRNFGYNQMEWTA